MLQPKGFEEQGNLVCRLTKLILDHCTHYNGFEDTDFIILLLYVDGMLMVGPNKD